MSRRSFTVQGSPSSIPNGRPAAQRAALSPAATIACGFIATNAFSTGFNRATRAVTACNASTGDNARDA